MIIPNREPCPHHKFVSTRPGYGERKRKREQDRYPLFANDPAFIDPAEVYQARMDTALQAQVFQWRQRWARDWRLIRRWLRNATAENRALWYQGWNQKWSPPHDAGNAVSLAWRIDHPGPIKEISEWEMWRQNYDRPTTSTRDHRRHPRRT